MGRWTGHIKISKEEQNKRTWAKHRHKHLEKNRLYKRERIRVAREFLNNYKKTHPCSKCGESHIACLDFHHVEKKEENISRLQGQGARINKLQDEIKKCVILCSNCHRKLHFEAPLCQTA